MIREPDPLKSDLWWNLSEEVRGNLIELAGARHIEPENISIAAKMQSESKLHNTIHKLLGAKEGTYYLDMMNELEFFLEKGVARNFPPIKEAYEYVKKFRTIESAARDVAVYRSKGSDIQEVAFRKRTEEQGQEKIELLSDPVEASKDELKK